MPVNVDRRHRARRRQHRPATGRSVDGDDPRRQLARRRRSRQVVARVPIDASALNIDREVDLVAVDSNGNQVPDVEIEPQRARVRIAVARELANRTLPVVPAVVGEPAPGYRIASVTVEPLVVTVSGEAGDRVAAARTHDRADRRQPAGRRTSRRRPVRAARRREVSGDDTVARGRDRSPK